MIENYEKLSDGRIKQIENQPFAYGYNYSNNYNTPLYIKNSEHISYLRYAYLVGAIGKIPNSILDVGYGNGDFLSIASKQINKCYGYDISDYPVPKGSVKVNSMTDHFYEVITFFDSLEHFEDISFVENLNCNFVCISLPWCHYFSDEWFSDWKHRKPDEHLWHFNLEALMNFMSSNGFSFITHSNIEDQIRIHDFNYPNILTAIFKKI
jgi:hypothetical protein